jgi:hypothetical protein
MPYHGLITWADVALNESTSRAEEIALHEIAHVLGFGTQWASKNLIETQFGVPVYTGRAALAMYRFAVDSAAQSIPLQPDAADAQVSSHWSSSWAAVNDQIFDVMSAQLSQNETGRFISTVTVGAINDLGYQVNYSQADLDWPSTKDKYPTLRSDAPVTGAVGPAIFNRMLEVDECAWGLGRVGASDEDSALLEQLAVALQDEVNRRVE